MRIQCSTRFSFCEEIWSRTIVIPRTWIRKEMVFYSRIQTTRRMGQSCGTNDVRIRRKRTSNFPCYKSICPEVSSKAKAMDKLSIHHCADLETIQTVFRTIFSVNQLSLYGAVEEMCEEYETFHDRTGQPVVGGRSSSSFVPIVIKTNVLLNNDLLLRQYGERMEK